MRLSKLTDYAVVMMVHMGQISETATADVLFTAARLSDETGVPQPTVAKVLKSLARAGLLRSVRGAQGGYVVERTPEQISIAEIVQALDGPIALTACVDGADDSCNVESLCGMRGNWNRVNEAIRSALGRVTLADMALTPMEFPVPDQPARPAYGHSTSTSRGA